MDPSANSMTSILLYDNVSNKEMKPFHPSDDNIIKSFFSQNVMLASFCVFYNVDRKKVLGTVRGNSLGEYHR